MKKRNYTELRYIKNPDGSMTLEHMTSEIDIPNESGAYIANPPCGVGKTSSLTSLIKLHPNEGFIFFGQTISECETLRNMFLQAGVSAKDIAVIHNGSENHDIYKKTPDLITTKRIVIIPSINLYQGCSAVLLAYDKGRKVDVTKYLGNTLGLINSNQVRAFIIIDEQPDFILPFAQFNPNAILSHFGEIKSRKTGGVVLSTGERLFPMSLEKMKVKYDAYVSKTSDRFYGEKTKLNEYRTIEILEYIRTHFVELSQVKGSRFELYHFLKDLVTPNMQTKILILDATADVLSDYKISRSFRLLTNRDKSYSSPIEFAEFPMSVPRWLFDKCDANDEAIRDDLQYIIDILEKQINAINGKLLIVTWKYMVSKSHNPEQQDKEIDIMRILSEELDKRGLNGQYAIIYRGSGEDKATNSYSDFAGVTFLGEWKTNNETLKKLNKNYGIKATEMKVRLAALIQTVCRIRIRQHAGDKIWVFYSSDINKELMKSLYEHFEKNTEAGVLISGMPKHTGSKRKADFIDDMAILCQRFPNVYAAIKKRSPVPIDISLNEFHQMYGLVDKKRRTYAKRCDRIKAEYGITINVV